MCRVDERDKKAKSGIAMSGVPPDWEIEISSEKQRSKLIHTKWGRCGKRSRVFLKNGDGSVLGLHLMCPASNRPREKSVQVISSAIADRIDSCKKERQSSGSGEYKLCHWCSKIEVNVRIICFDETITIRLIVNKLYFFFILQLIIFINSYV